VPGGLSEKKVLPATAFWDNSLGEFLLQYDDMRCQRSPDDALLEFIQSAYDAAADSAKWDRAALERNPPKT
jgi:hypothetical protein